MTKKNLLNLNLEKFTEQVKTLPVMKMNQLESICMDICNYCYDTYEFLGDEFSDKIETMQSEVAKETTKSLKALDKQVVSLMDVLCEIKPESKNLLRAKYMLGEMEEEIPELIRQLKKVK